MKKMFALMTCALFVTASFGQLGIKDLKKKLDKVPSVNTGGGNKNSGNSTNSEPVNVPTKKGKDENKPIVWYPSRYYTPADGQLLYTECNLPSSALHKANLDKIVFGSKKIDANGDASQLKSEFKLGEPIYGRAFLRTSMCNYKTYLFEVKGVDTTYYDTIPAKLYDGFFRATVSIDGKLKDYYLFQYPPQGEISKWSSFTVMVNGQGDDADLNNEMFFKDLNELPDGKHNIHLEITTMQGQFLSPHALATGDFVINKTGGKIGLGRNFDGVPANMSDTELENKCLAKMKDHAKANGWKETFTQVKITSEDWYIVRNEVSGAITGRSIEIAAKATWPDGHCTYQFFDMFQQYDGTAYQKSVSVAGTGEQTDIDCN